MYKDVNVELSEDGSFLIGRVNRPMTSDKAYQITKLYVEKIESTGIKLILNDMRTSILRINVEQSFIYASKEVKTIGLPQDIRSAILVADGDHSHDFKEILAQSAGYKVRVFYSYENALRWLKSDE
ncbi:hypothetical protein [Pseudoalteromonas xiamenensis]